MSATFRPLLPGDVPAAALCSHATFAELDTRLGDPVPAYEGAMRARQEERVRHLQRTDPAGAWVAEHDGDVVGVALALRRGPLWFLSLLTVRPDLQARGVGRRLLDAALATAGGSSAQWILSSPDPKALRRYALAGFALHPGYDARGAVDRSAVPSGLGEREGDLRADADFVDDVVLRLRGAPYGPDLEAMARTGCRLLCVEDGAERGFCVVGHGRVAAVGATAPGLARRALWAGLATAEGQSELSFLTADQQWAIDVVLAARLTITPGSSSCRRGALGPLTPYLPTGAFG